MLTVLVTVDCGRADHVVGPGAETPVLDAFREKEAVTFTAAQAHSNTTLPSHVTLFTGLLMAEHGVTHNFFQPAEGHLFLADALAARGEKTAGFVGISFLQSLYASRMGGDDSYFDIPRGRLASALLRRLGVRGFRRGAAKTLDAAARWLAGRGKGPGLCWVHLFDTHMDYQADRRWRRRYGVPEKPTARSLEAALEEAGLCPFSPVKGEYRPLDYYPSLYKASISHTDALLGRFFARLKAEGLWEESAVIVTADHGENLTEHGVYCGHPLLFDETIRVPLLVKFPGGDHGGESVSSPVGHEDVAPTILAFHGVEEGRGRGVDLASTLGGGGVEADRALLSFHNKMFQGAVRKKGLTWIENLDLAELREERRPLYEKVGLFGEDGRPLEDAEAAESMRGILHAYLDEVKNARRAEVLEDETIKAQLRGLGYME